MSPVLSQLHGVRRVAAPQSDEPLDLSRATIRQLRGSDTLATFMQALGHDPIVVDHRSPIHDGFCRCTSCKPPRVGATSQALTRVTVAAAIGGITAAAIVAGSAARAGGLL